MVVVTVVVGGGGGVVAVATFNFALGWHAGGLPCSSVRRSSPRPVRLTPDAALTPTTYILFDDTFFFRE